MRNKPLDAAVYGVDLGKSVFHVFGLDGAENAIRKVTLRRGTLLVFFERAAPAIVAMEPAPAHSGSPARSRHSGTRCGTFQHSS